MFTNRQRLLSQTVHKTPKHTQNQDDTPETKCKVLTCTLCNYTRLIVVIVPPNQWYPSGYIDTYVDGICIAAGPLRCSTTVVWWTGSVGHEPLQLRLTLQPPQASMVGTDYEMRTQQVVTSRAVRGGPSASTHVASVPFTGTLAETKAGPPGHAMAMPTPAAESVKEPSHRISQTVGRGRVRETQGPAGVEGTKG